MTPEDMTPRDYVIGVAVGILVVKAVWYALRSLWEAAKTPGRIRRSEQALAQHVARAYPNRIGTMERRSQARG